MKATDLMPVSVEGKFGYVYPAVAVGNWGQLKNQYENILCIDAKNSQVHYTTRLIFFTEEKNLIKRYSISK